MSQDEFQDRIARIQQRRAAEKSPGAAPAGPSRIAAMPQGTPEGFKVPRKHERKGEVPNIAPGLQGLGTGLLVTLMFFIATNQHPEAASLTPEARAEYFRFMLDDPDAPAEHLPMVFLACAAVVALVVQPLIGLGVGGWGVIALVMYLGASVLGVTGVGALLLDPETGMHSISGPASEGGAPAPGLSTLPPPAGAAPPAAQPDAAPQPVAPARPQGTGQ